MHTFEAKQAQSGERKKSRERERENK
jgi:hypothetical protein